MPAYIQEPSSSLTLSVTPMTPAMDTTTATPRPKTKMQLLRERREAERKKFHSNVEPPATPVTSRTRDQVHRAVMLASLSGESTVEDVKFFAFSRRTRAGAVNTPLPIITNTTLLRKASSHFDYLIRTDFSEGGLTDMNAPYPSTRPSVYNCYDYMSDSDLDEEEEESDVAKSDVAFTVEPETAVNALDDGDATIRAEAEAICERTDRIVKPGRVVFLDDIAHNTWKAFAFYAYFGDVAFAPLKSEHKPRTQGHKSYNEPVCSPKSMYRIAEKYDVAALKDQAFTSIKSSLSPHNILEELFSTFTSAYPAVQEIELQYLYDNIKDTGIQARLPTWLHTLEQGHLPKGAASIMGSLMSKLLSAPPQIITQTVEVTAPLPPGMKTCPGGCTTYSYRCNGCSRNF